MAKKQTFGDKLNKNKKKSTQELNFFGTTKNMVIKEFKDDQGEIFVIAKDDQGHYLTSTNHVDSGLMDPNRSSGQRTVPTEEQLKKTNKS